MGPTGIGKSYLLNQLRELFRVYDVPHESWNDTYQDGIYDLIVMDEFNGQKTITEMNLLTDGYQTPLKRRGTSPYLKTDCLPVILCSNKYPLEVYHNVFLKDKALVEAFNARYELLDFFSSGDAANPRIEVQFTLCEPEAIVLESDEDSEGSHCALATASEASSSRPSTKRKFDIVVCDSD